ncbi:very long chain fatty acid elongase 7-like [Brevipalpus obovatus]|uniref:very long chain fatty acid elongase 7-like n=1 Tax=Brevipalpus obovatus TaxID=246614 RepID=UPI003D9E5EB8
MSLSYVKELYREAMIGAEPKTNEYFLLRSPLPTLTLVSAYVLFVKFIGPAYMKNRKPFKLNNAMLVYNIATVFANLFLVIQGIKFFFFEGGSLRCETIKTAEQRDQEFPVVFMFYIIKLTEFMDTIFAVLRKKQSQVSNLHVLHHGSLPISVWIGMKFVPGGHGIFFGWLNCCVHVVMYSYYALSAMGPSVQKYLWWKKYLTMLQLAHFVAIILHQSQVFFNGCEYPKWLSAWIMLNASMFWILFMDFYSHTYNKKVPKDEQYILSKLNNNNKEIKSQ